MYPHLYLGHNHLRSMKYGLEYYTSKHMVHVLSFEVFPFSVCGDGGQRDFC